MSQLSVDAEGVSGQRVWLIECECVCVCRYLFYLFGLDNKRLSMEMKAFRDQGRLRVDEVQLKKAKVPFPLPLSLCPILC